MKHQTVPLAFLQGGTGWLWRRGWGITAVFLPSFFLLSLLFTQLHAAPGETAVTISVTTTQDELNTDGDCSLREAIETVNLASQVDNCVIVGSGDFVINIPAGSYFLTRGTNNEEANQGGDFDILASVTIQGGGAASTRLDANLLDRVFDIDPADNATITVTIADVTIQNGFPISKTGGGGIRNFDDTVTVHNAIISDNRLTGAFVSGNTDTANGGGIFSGGGVGTNAGVLNVINTVIDDNSSTYGSGGGIYNNGGIVNISSSTISNNRAEIIQGTASGGGISNIGGTVNMINSTISGNEADGQAGGVLNFFSFGVMNVANSTFTGNSTPGSGGGIRNSGEMYLTNVTITDNTADTDAAFGGLGGGIRNSGTLHMKGVIIYGNFDVDSPDVDNDEFPDIYDTGTLLSQGFNLLGVITGTTTITDGVNGDQVGADPLLRPLTGSPAYFSLGLNSPALNVMAAVDCTYLSWVGNSLFSPGTAVTTDQPGNTRPDPVQLLCDAGAFEATYYYLHLPFMVD